MADSRLLELVAPNALFRSLIDHSPIMLWAADAEGHCVFVSQAWLTFTGRALSEELGAGWADNVHVDDRREVLRHCREALALRQPFALEYRLRRADGAYRWVSDQRQPWLVPDGAFLGYVGTCVESQGRLRESEDQLRQLAARLQTAREEERAQVARELHDELGQTLTALKLDISRTIQALGAENLTPIIIDRIQSLVGLSDIALATVKRIATSLRPPTLDHFGLAEAIHWEAVTFKARTGLRCQVRSNSEKEGTNLSALQQTSLFRIFQEALTNIARHAQASAVRVTLTERDDWFELRIHDNGRGIREEEAADPRAIGLLGMRERAALAGGAFSISGRRRKGTVVSVQVPISHTLVKDQGVRRRQKQGTGHSSQ